MRKLCWHAATSSNPATLLAANFSKSRYDICPHVPSLFLTDMSHTLTCLTHSHTDMHTSFIHASITRILACIHISSSYSQTDMHTSFQAPTSSACLFDSCLPSFYSTES
ncbi:MAG: hypothetical protein ACK55Z_28380 [bacterium]